MHDGLRKVDTRTRLAEASVPAWTGFEFGGIPRFGTQPYYGTQFGLLVIVYFAGLPLRESLATSPRPEELQGNVVRGPF